MRICILTHTFPRFKKDVVAPFMDGVASGISENNNDVFVLTPYSNGFDNTIKRKYKLVTYKYIYPNFLHKIGYSQTLENDMKVKSIMYLLSPFFYIFGVVNTVLLVKKEKIDLINAHWILPNGFIAAIASKLTGVPVVSTLPGSDVYMANKNIIFRWMAQIAVNTSVTVTSNSPQLFEDLSKIGNIKKNFKTIIYGVDPKKFIPNATKKLVLKRQYKIPLDHIVVLGVGRLVEKKGFTYLIKAAAKILKTNNNVTFVVVGDGDQRDELENLINKLRINENFKLIGRIDYANLVHYYNLGDIFILPSIRDKTGNLDDQSVALVEAMGCGKPVVTTNFSGYQMVVMNGENGYLVPEKNEIKIAEALNKLIESNKLRAKMGKKGREMVLKYFSWKAIGKQYTSLFENIIS